MHCYLRIIIRQVIRLMECRSLQLTETMTGNKYEKYSRTFVHFRVNFFLGRVAEAAALGHETRHGQQQSQTVLLTPQQGGTKQVRKCN